MMKSSDANLNLRGEYPDSDMPGYNLFIHTKRYESKANSQYDETAVFISHRKADVEEARQTAQAIMETGLDVYFDEDDECLAGADEETDPERVVGCINAGLAWCGRLLGIITRNTAGSWWVPYEIGVSVGYKRACAFLVAREVVVLPAYVKAATILTDRAGLKKWLPEPVVARQLSKSHIFIEGLRLPRAGWTGPEFLPVVRDSPLDFRASVER